MEIPFQRHYIFSRNYRAMCTIKFDSSQTSIKQKDISFLIKAKIKHNVVSNINIDWRIFSPFWKIKLQFSILFFRKPPSSVVGSSNLAVSSVVATAIEELCISLDKKSTLESTRIKMQNFKNFSWDSNRVHKNKISIFLFKRIH